MARASKLLAFPVGAAAEAIWLAAVFLIPLVLVSDQSMLSWVTAPKAFVFRTLALLMAVVLVVGANPSLFRLAPGISWVTRALRHPTQHMIGLSIVSIAVATVVSTMLSPGRSVSVFGVDTVSDTHGLFTLAGLMVLFGGVALHLRTRHRFTRLLWAVTVASLLTSFYGIGQHYGIDFARTDPSPVSRPPLTLGNPIFAGSYLVLTIPLTMALVLSLRERMSSFAHLWAGALLLAPQLTALILTLSRGPWLGIVVGMSVMLAALGFSGRRAEMKRAMAVAVLAGALAVAIGSMPSPSGAEGAVGDEVVDRLTGSAAAGSIEARFDIWATALDVYSTGAWTSSEWAPEAPELPLPGLHYLIGYGPNNFTYAYRQSEAPTSLAGVVESGHNFLIHSIVELGLWGVFSYLGLVVGLAVALYQAIHRQRQARSPEWVVLTLGGLAGALTGRVVEQMFGKAQLPDLLMTWVLVGMIVALVSLPSGIPVPGTAPASLAKSHALPRFGVAALVAIAGVAVWVQWVLPPIRAAVLTQDATNIFVDADVAGALSGLSDAMRADVNHATSRLRFARLESVVAMAATDDAEKIERLEAGYVAIEEVIARDPLSHAAWSQATEISRELAVLGQRSPAEAVRVAGVFDALLPSFWEAGASLAWTHAVMGDFESSLHVIDNVIEARGGQDWPVPHFVRATALRGSGRTAEALVAAQRSFELGPTQATEQLLQALRSE